MLGSAVLDRPRSVQVKRETVGSSVVPALTELPPWATLQTRFLLTFIDVDIFYSPCCG